MNTAVSYSMFAIIPAKILNTNLYAYMIARSCTNLYSYKCKNVGGNMEASMQRVYIVEVQICMSDLTSP